MESFFQKVIDICDVCDIFVCVQDNKDKGVIIMQRREKKVKFRKTWDRDPVERPHSSKRGLKGYDRSSTRRMERSFRNGQFDVDFE